MTPLDDPMLWAFIIARVVFFLMTEEVVLDGYHLREGNILEWEETHVLVSSALELPIFLWLTTWTVEGIAASLGLPEIISIFGIVRVTLYTVVMGGLFLPLRWSYMWLKTLQDIDETRIHALSRASGFLSCVLFGTAFGMTIYVALHPSAEMLQFHLSQHIVIVSSLIRQFQAVLGVEVARIFSFGGLMLDIFINNATLALAGSVLALIGGLLYGLGITFGLVMAANASIIAGVFAGIIIRNSIIAGKGLIAAPMAFIASFGVFHGFLEFLGIVVTFTGVGFVTFGLVKGELGASVNGAKVGFYGLGIILFGAFTEVFVDPQIVNFLKLFLVIKPQIAPVSLGVPWVIGTISTLLTVGGLILAVAWATRQSVSTMEGQL